MKNCSILLTIKIFFTIIHLFVKINISQDVEE